jgi:hypothetical protein
MNGYHVSRIVGDLQSCWWIRCAHQRASTKDVRRGAEASWVTQGMPDMTCTVSGVTVERNGL